MSLQWDSTDDQVSAGTSNNIAPYNSAWSFACWGKPTVDTIGGGDPRIFLRGSVYVAFSTVNKFYVNVDGSTGLLRFTAASTVIQNTWGHFCITSDGSSTAANYKMYYNGSEVTYNDAAIQNGVTPTSNAGATLYIGNNATGSRPFSGNMMDVAFWNTQITSGNAATLANGGNFRGAVGKPLTVATANLQLYCPFNDFSDGSTANSRTYVDKSGNANNGTGIWGTGGSGLVSFVEQSYLSGAGIWGF